MWTWAGGDPCRSCSVPASFVCLDLDLAVLGLERGGEAAFLKARLWSLARGLVLCPRARGGCIWSELGYTCPEGGHVSERSIRLKREKENEV